MADNTHTIHYARALQNWPKGIGPKPTNEMLGVAHALMKKGTGSKHALVLAMAMRPAGMIEYEHRCAAALLDGGTYYTQPCLFNYVRTNLEGTQAPLTRNMLINPSHRLNPIKGKPEPVWQVTLSEAGKVEVARRAPVADAKAATKAAPLVAAAKVAAKAAKAVAKATPVKKPRKGKAALPAPVTVDAPAPVDVPVTVDQPVTDQPQA